MKYEETLCPLAIIKQDRVPHGIVAYCDPTRCMWAIEIQRFNPGRTYVCALAAQAASVKNLRAKTVTVDD